MIEVIEVGFFAVCFVVKTIQCVKGIVAEEKYLHELQRQIEENRGIDKNRGWGGATTQIYQCVSGGADAKIQEQGECHCECEPYDGARGIWI